MVIEIKKKRLGLGPKDQTISDLDRKNKAKAKAARVSEEKAPMKNKSQSTLQSTQQTLSELDRKNRMKKSMIRKKKMCNRKYAAKVTF